MLLGAAAAVVVLGGIRAIAWLIGPAFLALVIVVALSPVQSWLRRHHWPGWLTTLVLVVLVVGVLAVLAVVVVVSLARLAALLPQYADRADELRASLAGSLADFGVAPGQLREAVEDVSPVKVVALIGAVLAGLSSAVTSVVFLVCLMFFLSVEASGMDRRLAAVAADRPGPASALRAFAQATRSYLVVSTVFGLIVGAIDVVVLVVIGVPLPLLWGVLSFITNYVPNVGFVIGVIPPALLALLTLGVSEMVLVIVIYSLVNFVIQSLIQPRFVGDSVGLAMTTTFVALVFWAWLLGPLGALLAIPLTLLFKSLLVDVDPTARWASALAGSLAPEAATPPRAHPAAAVPVAGAPADDPPPVPASGGQSADSSPASGDVPAGSGHERRGQ